MDCAITGLWCDRASDEIETVPEAKSNFCCHLVTCLSQSNEKHFWPALRMAPTQHTHSHSHTHTHTHTHTFSLTHTHAQVPDFSIDVVFGNIAEVATLSGEFLAELQKVCKEEKTVGKVFVMFAVRLRDVYSLYCRNHDTAVATLEKVSILV